MKGQRHDLPDARRSFSSASRALLARQGLSGKVRAATGHTAKALERLASEDPRWGERKDHAAQVKRHALTHLPELVEKLVDRIEARGGKVHFAHDAREARDLVVRIARDAGCRRCIKAKSMTSEEVELNPALEAAGVEVFETDVGEMILQLGRDRPSHITAPAIHLSVDDVDEIYGEVGLATAPPPPAGFRERATFLSLEARRHLREPFLAADLGISGANLLVAETGGIVLVENEGNIRLSTTVPRVHVAIAGPDKLVRTEEDAGAILALLAPSATGQRQSGYVSFLEPPLPGREFHLVLLDADRSKQLADPELYETLACIRCGACMNHCPVYRQVGGHAYGHEVPGPIGKVLLPGVRHSKVSEELPFTSSLCGACEEVCPVRIPIPRMLLAWRSRLAPRKLDRRLAFGRWRRWMESTDGYARFRRLLRLALRRGWFGRTLVRLLPPAAAWHRTRELPELPEESFREWWARREAAGGES